MIILGVQGARPLEAIFFQGDAMAYYEHLPIYRESFQFLLYCELIVKNFSKYHKYSHGADLRDITTLGHIGA